MKKLLILLVFVLFLASCADSNNVEPCLTGHIYGFWAGLWHGIIAPIVFIVSFFRDDVAVFALNNNGHWYTFGFLLGIGAFTTCSCKSTN